MIDEEHTWIEQPCHFKFVGGRFFAFETYDETRLRLEINEIKDLLHDVNPDLYQIIGRKITPYYLNEDTGVFEQVESDQYRIEFYSSYKPALDAFYELKVLYG